MSKQGVIVAKYTTQLLKRSQVAEGSMAFHFAKPSGFEFKPGQAMDVILPGLDAETASHTFSIVTAPDEATLMIATRMRDSTYKRALGALAVGANVEIDGPSGSLTLHRNPSRAGVLITGGIGITPFISMLRSAAKNRIKQPLLLLYSNRRPEDAAFLAELERLEKQNSSFHMIATMTDMEHSSQAWRGHTEMIDSAFVKSAVKNLPEPIYYLTGPPGMVEAMRKVLSDAGVDEDDVRSEEFYGY